MAKFVMQNCRSTNDWMAGERQLFKQIEHAGTHGVRLGRGFEKHGLKMSHLLRNPPHLFGAQDSSIQENGQAVARCMGLG
jgi:hypothetical protein